MQVVVLTASTLAEATRVDAVCRDNGVAFIRAETRGVFASVFTDFGPTFTVLDTDGAFFSGAHQHAAVSRCDCIEAWRA